jgi:hypothetical protein
MNINRDFADFIRLLNQHGAEYMVVGGYAVGLHGHPRFTGDLDVWINRTEENIDKVLAVVRDFGGPMAQIDRNKLLENATKTNPSPGISFGREPVRIEVLTAIDGVEFVDCYQRVQYRDVEGIMLKFIHYDDLLKNKRATGRTKDTADIEDLEKKRKNQ